MKKIKNGKHGQFSIVHFNLLNKSFLKNLLIIFLTFICTGIFFILLYKIYIPRVNAFGCFDDCFNFLGGYFMLHGKKLYSEIFFNHQPFFAVISYFVQQLSTPVNIYDLVLKHRQLLFIFALLFDILLILRFKAVGVFFVFTYELTKFYFSGDRFLAEGFVIYPLVYVFALTLKTVKKEKLFAWDFLLGSIFTWFVIFSREPLIPLAIVTYCYILVGNRADKKPRIISLVLFLVLFFATLLYFLSPQYFFQVVTMNNNTIIASDLKGKNFFSEGIFTAIFYPFYIILKNQTNLIWTFLTKVTWVFLLSFILLLRRQKTMTIKYLLIIFSSLFLANIRYAEPGLVFYATSHILPWYGMYLFATYFLINELLSKNKKVSICFFLLLAYFNFLLITDKSYFAREKIDPHEEYLTQYGPTQQSGSVFRELASKDDKLFLDGFDDLIYWEAKLTSGYRYSWYTSIMPGFPVFTKARLEMFKNYPPEFYYGSCESISGSVGVIPKEFIKNYVMLTSQGKPTCLYVSLRKLSRITEAQWKKAGEWLYDKPSVLQAN